MTVAIVEQPQAKRNRANRTNPRWESHCRCGVMADCQCERCGHGVCNEHERWYNVWEGDGDLACPPCYRKLHWWPSKPDRYKDANKG